MPSERPPGWLDAVLASAADGTQPSSVVGHFAKMNEMTRSANMSQRAAILAIIEPFAALLAWAVALSTEG